MAVSVRPVFAAIAALAVGCTFSPPAGTVDDRGRGTDGGEVTEDASATDASSGADAEVDSGMLVNRPPLPGEDRAEAFEATPVEIDVLANDSDPDGDPLTLSSAGTAENGAVQVTASQTLRYQPDLGFSGSDEVTYVVADGRGGEATGRVVVEVFPALSVSPSTVAINLNSRITLSAVGGVPPVLFRIAAGSGRIAEDTGSFFSPGVPGDALVTVEDAVGQTATATVVFGRGDLFFIGGVGEDPSSSVFHTADGESWTEVPESLPSPTYLLSAAVFEDAIYAVGGRDLQINATDTVLRSTDGVSWDATRTAPTALRGAQLVVFRERLFLLGGRDGSDITLSDVWSSTDGDVWTHEGNLRAARAYGSAVVHADTLFYLGGRGPDDLETRDTVWFSTDGVSWAEATNLLSPRRHAAPVSFGGALWLLGGYETNAGVDTVWTTTDGAGWTPQGPLPERRGGASAVGWRDQLWVVGGSETLSGGDASDRALTLTQAGWRPAGQLGGGRFWGAVVIFAP